MSAETQLSRRAAMGVAGLALGGALAFVELLFVICGTLATVVPTARHGVGLGAQALVAAERRRLVTFFEFDDDACETRDSARSRAYLLLRSFVGGIGAGILLLVLLGLASGVIMVVQLVEGRPIGGGQVDDADWYDPIALILFGVLLLFLAVWGLIGVAVLDRTLAQRFLMPSPRERLRRRVFQLATSRAGVVAAVNEERRRIERDLHDGVQQRLVALGMLLGRARRASDPAHTDDLLRQAHEESQEALRDLREVTWRVYPTALDDGGLHPALEAVAERSSVPVQLHYQLEDRPDPALETVAYFVASEAVTNALKHGDPDTIEIVVGWIGEELVVVVTDDGVGGAQVNGSGLSGLARRVAAVDGTFSVRSPPGGPTIIVARLPCV